MMQQVSKKRVLQALLDRTKAELSVAAQSQKRSQEAATHEESKPENDKDTRAVEASYLARGQAERVASLEAAVVALSAFSPRNFSESDPIALGALLWVNDAAGDHCYFLAPAGGGGALVVDGVKVQPITPQTPVGRALLGGRVGDDISFRAPGGVKEWSVIAVE